MIRWRDRYQEVRTAGDDRVDGAVRDDRAVLVVGFTARCFIATVVIVDELAMRARLMLDERQVRSGPELAEEPESDEGEARCPTHAPRIPRCRLPPCYPPGYNCRVRITCYYAVLMRIIAFLAGITAAGCGLSNQSGDFAAEGTGDLTAEPAKRQPFDTRMVALCGDGGPTERGETALARLPYLQQVTTTSALVVWTSEATTPHAVDVTTTERTPVATVAGARDGNTMQYVARLDGLQPDTVYCYQLVDAGGRPLTLHSGFKTAPAGGTPVSFVAIGDSGWEGPDQDAIVAQMESYPFDLFIHTGDIAYDTGTFEQFERTFFAPYARILQSFPAYAVSGNHEYETDDAAPYRQVFVLPENGGEDGRERWFSFDWGDVHFVALDTERVGADQARWLEADLAANTRPWTVVYTHRPPYSSGEHGSDLEVRSTFGPILERYAVPLVLSGHDHNYERTVPMNGVTYVVTGGGGRGTRDVSTSEFTAFSEAVLHIVYVTIDGDRLTLHAIDGTGREFDNVVITRPSAPRAPPVLQSAMTP